MRILVLGLTLCLLPACRVLQPTESSTKHDLGKPVTENRPWQWMEMTPEAYADHTNEIPIPGMAINKNALLPKNHAATIWIQAWVDRIDSYLRKTYPDALKSTPKPQAAVVKDDTINAFVRPVLVCTGYTLAASSAEKAATFRLFQTTEGAFHELPSFTCPKVPSELETDMQNLIGWQLAKIDGCKAEFKDKKISLTSECGYREEKEAELVVLVHPNVFVMFSGLLENFSEEAAIGTIAHELGHYYKAHDLRRKSDYGYLYSMGAHNPDSKPERDPSLAGLQERLDEAISKMQNASLVSYPGQRYDTLTMILAWHLLVATNAKLPACQLWFDSFITFRLGERAYPFEFSSHPEMNREGFDKVEATLESCADQIKIKKEENEQDIENHKSVSIDSMTIANVIVSLVEQGYFSPSVAQKIGEIYIEKLDSLGDVIRGLQAGMKPITAMNAPYDPTEYADIFKADIGYYTFEQEADELAAEWLSNVGINPNLVSEATLDFIKYNPPAEGSGILSEAECRALYFKNWGGNGKLLFTMLDYDDHHTSCFRVFNISREISTHKYKYGSSKQGKVTNPSWDQIQVDLKKNH